MARTHLTTEREDEAAAMLSSTRFARGVAPALVAAFLGTMLIVPGAQEMARRRSEKEARPSVFHSSLLPLPKMTTWPTIPSGQELRAFENRLQDNSVVFANLRPRTQWMMTRYLRAGNGQVLIGADNWLFYDPEVRAITMRGFRVNTMRTTANSTQNAVRNDEDERHDSIPAIVHLRDQLTSRGVALVVMPIPVKATIYPEKLWPSYQNSATLPQNASFGKWKRALQNHGVRVLDVAPDLLNAKQRGESVFVPTDTHWTPRGAEVAAQKLGELIAQTAQLPQREPINFVRHSSSGAAPDDLVRVLGLPPSQTLFPRHTIAWNAVYTPSGKLCQAQQNADILVLGDSFTGIYANGGASLPQQLGFVLKRPVDWLAVPNGGSYLSRLKLVQEAAHRHDHLRGKRLVVLEFTVRDLCFGDWRVLNLPQ